MNDRPDNDLPDDQMEGLEDQLDEASMRLARMEQATGETVPLAIVRRLSDGENPLRVWREHRVMSLDQVAVAAQVPLDMLVAIERGKEDVPIRSLSRIAAVLRIELDGLVPWSE